MATLHATNRFNVEASMNAWLQAQISAITRPSWLPAFTFVFNAPDITIRVPCIAIFHFPVSQQIAYRGRYPGDKASGLMEVSIWVSRNRNASWNAHLMGMDSIVGQAFNSGSGVVISDYTTAPGTPTAQAYAIDLLDLEAVNSAPDPNPDLERRRNLIRYQWTIQSS